MGKEAGERYPAYQRGKHRSIILTITTGDHPPITGTGRRKACRPGGPPDNQDGNRRTKCREQKPLGKALMTLAGGWVHRASPQQAIAGFHLPGVDEGPAILREHGPGWNCSGSKCVTG